MWSVAALLLLAGCQAESHTFRIGYMICNSLQETRGRFEPLTAFLSRATGARFESVFLDTVDVEDSFAAGQIDFAHTNSLVYVTIRERSRALPIAAEKRGVYGVKTRGAVIARKDSGIRSLSDLKGKRFVFGPQWAPFGFLAEYALLLDAGIDPEVDLGYYATLPGTWKHEKAIYAVLYGEYDAGATPLIDLEEMAADGRISLDDLVILAGSPFAPYCTVSAAPSVPASWAEKVRAALTALDARATAEVGGERLLVLKRALIDGFETVSDGDYDELRRWARLAKMPPYQDL